MSDGKKADTQLHVAIVFIAGFFAFLAAAFSYFWQTANPEPLTFVGTLFGGWLGAIIGFYFGQKPAEDSRSLLREQLQLNRELVTWARGLADAAMGKLGVTAPPREGV